MELQSRNTFPAKFLPIPINLSLPLCGCKGVAVAVVVAVVVAAAVMVAVMVAVWRLRWQWW
jgi:hypothetical protein